jgi:hypothetical protein
VNGPGFIKMMRGNAFWELVKDHNAFILLAVIAQRARRSGALCVGPVSVAEAMLGDHDTYGMSRQEYRTALEHLTQWGLITTRKTNKGTVAKLVNTSIFDINAEDDQPPGQPSSNHPGTIAKPLTRMKEEKNGNSPSEVAHELAQFLFKGIIGNKSDFKGPEDITKWAAVVEGMIHDDCRQPQRIRELIQFSLDDHFWRSCIVGADALRRNFDVLDMRERSNRVGGKEPKRCFRRCGRMGVDYGFDDAGQEYWWCEHCQPDRKGLLARARTA